ncbi:phosphopantothenoylcysteine decarboxylase, partial [bacterium]|nr:phosphopantothenoylcysteine decarboxylase [bacterium]
MTKVLITAGPTYEPIDPVRFIGNRSSGKMGYAIAKAFLAKDFEVVLVSGPVNLQLQHPNLQLIRVESAAEMYHAVMQHQDYQIAVLSAAVADFTPKVVAEQKIKKTSGQDEMTIELVKTKDILATLGSLKKEGQFLVGFALETE